MGGVATVYRHSINLTLSPKHNSNWLRGNYWIYSHSNPIDYDDDFCNSIYRFSYRKDNDESMMEGVKYALEVTKNIMLPILDKITSLEACIEYQDVIGMKIYLYDDENFGNDIRNNFYNEGLLLIKTNNHNYFIKKLEIFLAEKDKKDTECAWSKLTLVSDNIFTKLYDKALAELERRKIVNIEVLRSYGLSL
jgi:hypothetical protein